jgi:crotonobetainyl-CoA:carnitine CoA-transferase CaiB-like acyl-CoA transferase
MGEHNAQVLAEAGFSPAEVAALAERRVIVAAT